MKKIIKVKCVNCGKDYLKSDRKNITGKGLGKNIRSVNTITCSKKCSREYNFNRYNKRKRKNIKDRKWR